MRSFPLPSAPVILATLAIPLLAGCAAGPETPAPPAGGGGHDHGLTAPAEIRTPPTVRMIEFHGHLGPYVFLGYRAGEAAREVLGSPGYFDLAASVSCPLETPRSCFIDGVQLGSGCTVGKRNLEVAAGERPAATFRSKKGDAVRIELRPDMPGRIAAWIAAEGVEATARKVEEMPRDEVFIIEKVGG
jgi:formylmethanofuran dehydrogenase subunit E